MCNKCEKLHSELCQNHTPYKLDNNLKNIFTGICKIENHSNELLYFCKTHNQLCCASCITKIKGNGNGQHTDCNICYIEEIKEDKQNKLKANIKCLEDLSNTIENSIHELNKLFQIINEKKETLKLDIQKIFTKIRNSLNAREDELLLEVDKKFEDLFFNEEIVKLGEKLPKRIKESINQGNIIKNEWNKNKINFLINSCIIIENDIFNIIKINEKIEKCNKIKSKIKINPEENE